MELTMKQRRRRCPMCGREFYPAEIEAWAYKMDDRPYCSWKCLRRRERGEEPTNEREPISVRIPPEQMLEEGNKCLEMFSSGMTQQGVADTLGKSRSWVAHRMKYAKEVENGAPD